MQTSTEHFSNHDIPANVLPHASSSRLGVPRCLVCSGKLEPWVNHLFDTRFGIDGDYEARRCSDCGSGLVHPLPMASELKHLYESYYNFGGREKKLYGRVRKWFFRSGAHRLWAAIDGDICFYTRAGSGRLLDLGCNEGRGLRIYSDNGYEVEGLELNEEAAAVAREAGFAVHTDLLETFYPSALFDVVVLSNVLEHSLDPIQMLRDVRRVLRPGGQVWISCPNSRSWFRSLFGRYWINWHAPFHIVHFSRGTLAKVLREAGFTGIELREVTPSLWVASSIIARLFASKGKPTRQLRNPFLLFGLMLVARSVLCPALYLCNRRGRGDCLVVSATSEPLFGTTTELSAN